MPSASSPGLVIALAVAGSPGEALAAADGLIDAAEATANPYVLSYALMAYGTAFRDADPGRAREAMRRGVVIAHDSGNRTIETLLACSLASLEAKFGDLLAALEYSAVAIRNYHDAGNTTNMRPALSGARSPSRPARTPSNQRRPSQDSRSIPSPRRRSRISTAIAHLRDVLGDKTYESLARKGETMTTSEIAALGHRFFGPLSCSKKTSSPATRSST